VGKGVDGSDLVVNREMNKYHYNCFMYIMHVFEQIKTPNNLYNYLLKCEDTHEIISSLGGFAPVFGSCFDDTTTLQKRVSPGKKTVDDKDASTITINPLQNRSEYNQLQLLRQTGQPVSLMVFLFTIT
jgi:hypothetical protein